MQQEFNTLGPHTYAHAYDTRALTHTHTLDIHALTYTGKEKADSEIHVQQLQQ